LNKAFFQYDRRLLRDTKAVVSGRKRALDLLALLILVPLALPAGLLIALAVWLDSAGPVIYRAERVGIGGRRFAMLKFRTMRCGAAGAGVAAAGDARITPVGRFLRGTRLDELPQLLNVARGQMSMVGPRPEAPEFVALHPDEYRTILEVPPGITGPTQLRFAGVEARLLSGHDDPETYYRDQLLPDKVAMDVDYARSRSNRRDLRVLCQTLVLPLILVWQSLREGGAAGEGDGLAGGAGSAGIRRSVAIAGITMAVVALPVLFAVSLGSPR
jgi:lipopolysaccharide/colanic/teichoic acid biosynthesis glycosyltransferase